MGFFKTIVSDCVDVIHCAMTKTLLAFLLLSIVAKGAFYRVQISDLEGAGKPEDLGENIRERNWRPRSGFQTTFPTSRFKEFSMVVPSVARQAEAFARGGIRMDEEAMRPQNVTVGEAILVIELDEPKEVKGFVDYWRSGENRWGTFACRIDPSKLMKCSAEEVEIVRDRYARHQLTSGARGGIWYRSQVESEVRGRRMEFDQTFSTLSGGRALAENMALDRELILGTGKAGEDVDLASIKGVTVKAIPWGERLPKEEIAVDALSKRVPEDQYFMVVPSLNQLFGLMDRIEESGTPILQSFSVGDQYRELPSRYRRQLGLDLPDVIAGFLPVKSVAVTGGDPFFPTGSDVAVILETDKVDSVFTLLQTAISAKAKGAGANSVGKGGFANESRSFSSYLAKLDGAVVVANSARQLERVLAVAKDGSHSLGSTDEYRFFRHRYPMGADESAYVFISDACLRHWASPLVRIAASRRSRALAALGNLTSQRIAGEELSQEFEPLLGKVTESKNQVFSERYGSLGFLTPISELKIERVSSVEKESYERWRRGYEGGWARFFDPIAIRLKMAKTEEELDMTILPLRVDSDYQEMISLVGEARLSKAATTVPKESLFHYAMALDSKGDLFKEASVSLIEILPSLKLNPLGWMGSSASVTLGHSLAWQSDFGIETLIELPVLLRVEVQSRIKLALFLTAVKGSIEVSGPDLVRWETREHEGRRYVAVIGDEEEVGAELSIYYAALPTALLVSLNEDMLKRALDREKEFQKGQQSDMQVFAQTSPGFLVGLGELGSSQSLEKRRRNLSWAALPILNEWRKSQSAGDPVDFHHVRFAYRITCPGGLGYRWNEKELTMESVAYGHPANPLKGAKPLDILSRFNTVEMNSSFEDGGMNLRVSLDEESTYQRPLPESAPRPEDDKIVGYHNLVSLPAGTISIHETDYPASRVEEAKTHKTETKVESVAQDGDRTVFEESFRSLTGEEGVAGRQKTEVGPKGSRLLSWTGNSELDGDSEFVPDKNNGNYEYPAEMWPGLVFQVNKIETWLTDGESEVYLSDAYVKVVGWEKIKGPDGVEVNALKLEWHSESLGDKTLDRDQMTEWLAPGHGMVKSISTSNLGNSTTRLVSIKKPK